ncbi:MAG: hypothetical protein ACLQGP_13840 [Isosphaeraceae bacterium]
MIDDGIEPVEVTGRWVGFYRHRWEQLGTFPIIAEIVRTGDKIAGEMYDQITERSDNLDNLVEIVREDKTPEDRRRLQQAIGRLGAGTVWNYRLPDTSDIQGKIKGSQVRFTKTYRGTVEFFVTVGEEPVRTFRRDRHQVQYSGQLDRDRMCIVGRWVIRNRGLFGWALPPAAWGMFELYKKS